MRPLDSVWAKLSYFTDSGKRTAVTPSTPLPVTNKEEGKWGYHSGTSGTLTMTGRKRVLQITAIALGSAGSFTINAGDTITLPYDSGDGASSSITIVPRANLIDPEIIFTGTDAYFVEWVV